MDWSNIYICSFKYIYSLYGFKKVGGLIMIKIYQITNCIYCPNSTPMDDKLYCTESKLVRALGDYKEITREDKFVLDSGNHALSNKVPDWCMLEDYKE